MPQIDAGFPWQGQRYNERLSPAFTRGLGRAMLTAEAEAAQHTGLFHARYDDIYSLQLTIRPALQIQPSQQAQWLALLNGNIGTEQGSGGNGS